MHCLKSLFSLMVCCFLDLIFRFSIFRSETDLISLFIMLLLVFNITMDKVIAKISKLACFDPPCNPVYRKLWRTVSRQQSISSLTRVVQHSASQSSNTHVNVAGWDQHGGMDTGKSSTDSGLRRSRDPHGHNDDRRYISVTWWNMRPHTSRYICPVTL